MKTVFKKSFSLFLALAITLTLFTFPSFAASAEFEFADDGEYLTLVSCNQDAVGRVTVPAEVEFEGTTREVKYIGRYAFADCTGISELIISEGIVTIYDYAFKDCTSLRTVNIPKTLKRCQYGAFEGCEDVTVNCYKSNYQFFSVYGLSNNIKVNILDPDKENDEEGSKNLNSLAELIKSFINILLSLFGIKL